MIYSVIMCSSYTYIWRIYRYINIYIYKKHTCVFLAMYPPLQMLTVSHLHQVNSLYRLFVPWPARPVPLARIDAHKWKERTGACRNTLTRVEISQNCGVVCSGLCNWTFLFFWIFVFHFSLSLTLCAWAGWATVAPWVEFWWRLKFIAVRIWGSVLHFSVLLF